MEVPSAARAVAAAKAIAASLGLRADDAIVLNDSNILTLRLLPCDVLARVVPAAHRSAQFEIDVARRLAESGGPVAALDPRVEPRVHRRDGFDITLWTYYAPVSADEIPPADYADALARLHAGMRSLDIPTPHFTDRVEEAQQILADRDRSPELAEPERKLLADTLRDLRGEIAGHGQDQLLHGEPHPGNLLATAQGPLFIDFETCCRGPVEFDLAHAPDELEEHYPGVDRELLRQCRILMLAMVTTWRWDRDDRLPDGRRLGEEWLGRMRSALGH
ncbi:aminoglycoside phosphotransferase family protein [Glycomyces sp. NPDC021274]|uniref:phosphotransferase enzyme family protein n=1 Tax=Glycomyces sp. NPDC021274 TaxID=3155120 RepID=UPI0033D1F4FC